MATTTTLKTIPTAAGQKKRRWTCSSAETRFIPATSTVERRRTRDSPPASATWSGSKPGASTCTSDGAAAASASDATASAASTTRQTVRKSRWPPVTSSPRTRRDTAGMAAVAVAVPRSAMTTLGTCPATR